MAEPIGYVVLDVMPADGGPYFEDGLFTDLAEAESARDDLNEDAERGGFFNQYRLARVYLDDPESDDSGSA